MIKVQDKRLFSSEGFLLADAILTKVGTLEYGLNEIEEGGDPTRRVKLNRSRKVLEEALPLMVGAAVTRGHPPEFVNDENTKDIVGAVVTQPVINDAGEVRAKIRVFHKDVIDGIESGKDELSPGFNFVLNMTGEDTGEIVEMEINHVAVVPRGRAGRSVRVLDHLPPRGGDAHTEETIVSDQAKLDEAVRQAVDKALAEDGAQKGSDPSKIVDGVLAAIKGPLDDIKSLKDAQTEAAAAEAKKKAEDEAAAEKKKTEDSVRLAEREKYQVIMDASPFLTDEQKEGILEKESQEVLRMALGDSIDQENKELSLDFLKGAFEIMKKAKMKADDESAEDKGLKYKEKESAEDEAVDYNALFDAVRTGDKQKELA